MNTKTKKSNAGRPTSTAADKIQTIAWYETIKLAINANLPGEVANYMQAKSEVLKWEQINHLDSKRWYKYPEGGHSPNSTTLTNVDRVIPNSSDIFNDGPFHLWHCLWGKLVLPGSVSEAKIIYDSLPVRGESIIRKNKFHEFELTICENDIKNITNTHKEDMDLAWFTRAVLTWRRRSEIAKLGALDNFPDGLYEAIVVGLDQPEIKNPLTALNVWILIREEIARLEGISIKNDVKKNWNIRLLGHTYLKAANPVQYYINNAIKFLTKI